MISYTIEEQHKRWGTPSIWFAQWLVNCIDYCQTTSGNTRFENWMKIKFGPSDALIKLRACYAGPSAKVVVSVNHIKRFHQAAVDLGVSDHFVLFGHTFCAENGLCAPERTLPPPARKDGEASYEWLARRDQEIVDGAQVFVINWTAMKTLAKSEFDRMQEQRVSWREDPATFCNLVEERTLSIAFPGRGLDETRSRSANLLVLTSQLKHAAWSQATAWFDECDKRGLNDAPAVLQELERDDEFLYQGLSAIFYVQALRDYLISTLARVLTSGRRVKNWFIRRMDSEGDVIAETDPRWFQDRSPAEGSGEYVLCELFKRNSVFKSDPLRHVGMLFKLLVKHPGQAQTLITAEGLELIRDTAIADDFAEDLAGTQFGVDLKGLVQNASSRGVTSTWQNRLLAMAPERPLLVLRKLPATTSPFERLRKTIWIQTLFWSNAMKTVNMMSDLADAFKKRKPQAYNYFFLHFDNAIQDLSGIWEKEPKSLVKVYGLYDWADVERPRVQDDPGFGAMLEELKGIDKEMREKMEEKGEKPSDCLGTPPPSPPPVQPAVVPQFVPQAQARAPKKPKARKRR